MAQGYSAVFLKTRNAILASLFISLLAYPSPRKKPCRLLLSNFLDRTQDSPYLMSTRISPQLAISSVSIEKDVHANKKLISPRTGVSRTSKEISAWLSHFEKR